MTVWLYLDFDYYEHFFRFISNNLFIGSSISGRLQRELRSKTNFDVELISYRVAVIDIRFIVRINLTWYSLRLQVYLVNVRIENYVSY